MSRAQLAERKARLEALCLYIKKPSDYDIDAHADEVLQIVDQLHRTREWTAPDGPRVHLEIERGRICFRKPREKAVDQPKPEDGTATPEDAIEHLRPFLGKKLSEVGFRYFGDDKAKEAELNKFLEDNGDVLFERLLGYGGDACSRDLRVFVRTFKVINNQVLEERLVVSRTRPSLCFAISKNARVSSQMLQHQKPQKPQNEKSDCELELVVCLDSVDAEDELRKRPCHATVMSLMEKDKVVMAEPFRGRALRP